MKRIPRLPGAQGADHGTAPSEAAGPPLRLAVLGDSSAAGVGAATHDEALAGQAAAAVAALAGRPVSWRVVARSGATTAAVRRDLVGRLTDPYTQWTPDVVLVAVGVNDVTRLRGVRAFRRDIDLLVGAIRARLGRPVPVLLAGLPPVHRFPALPAVARLVLGGHARRLDRVLRRAALDTAGVHHLPVSRLPVDVDEFFGTDRFHPSPAGYRTWGRMLAVPIAAVVDGTAATGC